MPNRVWLVCFWCATGLCGFIAYLGLKEVNGQFNKLESEKRALSEQKATLREHAADLFSLKHRSEEEALSAITSYEKEIEKLSETKELSMSLQISLNEAMDLVRTLRHKQFMEQKLEEVDSLFDLDWFRQEATAVYLSEREEGAKDIDRLVGHLFAATDHIKQLEEEVEVLEHLVSKSHAKKKSSLKKEKPQEILELKF